ncbi:MAG: hypothetical protein ACOX05_07275 [Bacillota bacterium]
MRLVYNINVTIKQSELEENFEVHIDVVTGEVVGGEMALDKGGSFGQAKNRTIGYDSFNFTRKVQRAATFFLIEDILLHRMRLTPPH